MHSLPGDCAGHAAVEQRGDHCSDGDDDGLLDDERLHLRHAPAVYEEPGDGRPEGLSVDHGDEGEGGVGSGDEGPGEHHGDGAGRRDQADALEGAGEGAGGAASLAPLRLLDHAIVPPNQVRERDETVHGDLPREPARAAAPDDEAQVREEVAELRRVHVAGLVVVVLSKLGAQQPDCGGVQGMGDAVEARGREALEGAGRGGGGMGTARDAAAGGGLGGGAPGAA
eukprot:CAMPEP_0206046468 /NCGR_PEP_ID=MMETSP1466-20131121/18683_1 /ASSEMBLY_ACC=CAM_ASM_001126 /TAXON_ID=44452 /ORGANISM="Pavlova gyrans, Strain CCMP608" /LENGTH=225 /DNA_ID=CAMNT_0053421445 /DNA_START=120 /DNA_END=793 /DNA_ORIENTATION=+